MEWMNMVRKAWSYSARREIFWPFFGITAVVMAVMFSAIGWFLYRTMTYLPSVPPASAMLLDIGLMVVAMLFTIVVMVIVQGGIIKNYTAPKERLMKSIAFAKTRFWSMIGAAFLLALVMIAVTIPFNIVSAYAMPGLMDFLSSLATMIAGLMFFFIFQLVIVDKKGAMDSMKLSYRIFKKDWLDVAIAMLIIAGIAIGLLAIPVIWVMLAGFDVVTKMVAAQVIGMTEIVTLIVGAALFMLAATFGKLFSLTFQTEVYQRLKKKR